MGRRSQGEVLFSGILWIIAIDVIAQLWLLTAGLEALLAHHVEALIPAAIASFGLLALNAALLLFVHRFDEQIRREAGPPE